MLLSQALFLNWFLPEHITDQISEAPLKNEDETVEVPKAISLLGKNKLVPQQGLERGF